MEHRQVKILLVDDADADVFMFSTAAENSPAAILLHCVPDGQQAIEYLSGSSQYSNRQSHPLPDAIVLDLRMPNVSAVQFLRWCRENSVCSHTNVVLLTGADPGDPELQQAIALGAKRVLFKPSNLHDWEDIVRQIAQIAQEGDSTLALAA